MVSAALVADRRLRPGPWWSLAAILLLAAPLAIGSEAAVAQDADLEAAKTAEQQTIGAAQANAADSSPAPAASDPSSESPKPQTQLEWFYHSLMPRYTVAFLFLSFCFVALLVMNFLALRRESVCPHKLVQAFEGHLNEKRYQEAYDLAKADDSFLGRVLAAGMAKLSAGYPQAVESMQAVGEDETMRLEHRLSYIAMIGTLAPMVGLLGTVDGMISSFSVIASDMPLKPSELAGGISTALIATLVGLWLAIPAVAFFGFFRNRLARLVFEAANTSEQMMSRFSAPKKA